MTPEHEEMIAVCRHHYRRNAFVAAVLTVLAAHEWAAKSFAGVVLTVLVVVSASAATADLMALGALESER